MQYIVLLIIMTLMASIASVFLKKGSQSTGLRAMLTNINLYIGGILYVGSALINIYVLRYMDYSIVMPMGSITYIWTLCFSYLFFRERITRSKVLGVLCICLGAVVINL